MVPLAQHQVQDHLHEALSVLPEQEEESHRHPALLQTLARLIAQEEEAQEEAAPELSELGEEARSSDEDHLLHPSLPGCLLRTLDKVQLLCDPGNLEEGVRDPGSEVAQNEYKVWLAFGS